MRNINAYSYRIWIALLAVTLLLFAIWQNSEAADSTTLIVTNQSDSIICKLYITPNINSGLQGERLGGGTMKHWARRAFTVEANRYDLLALDCNNNEIARWQRADLTQSQTWGVTRRAVGHQAIVVGTNDRDWDGIADADDNCVTVKETRNGIFDGDGCPDTIDDLLNFAVVDIGGYWHRIFNNSGIQYHAPSNVEFSWRSDYLAYYDPSVHTIALSRVFATQAVDNIGDFAPVVALAHEWGHLVQANLGLLGLRYNTRTLELQADCFAGAYTRDAEARGQLDVNDANEGAQLLIGLGDDLPHNHPNSHGSGGDRATAYELGYENGPRSCMGYTTR